MLDWFWCFVTIIFVFARMGSKCLLAPLADTNVTDDFMIGDVFELFGIDKGKMIK